MTLEKGLNVPREPNPPYQQRASKPFDSGGKELIELRPLDWVHLQHLPGDSAILRDTDIGTIVGAADKVLEVQGPEHYLYNIELSTRYHPETTLQSLLYCVVWARRSELPMVSTIVLLRPEADHASLTGLFQRFDPPSLGGECYLEFRYRVLRIWQMPSWELLEAGLGVAVLAVLGTMREGELPAVMRRLQERIQAEAKPEEAERFWTIAVIMLGLKHKPEEIRELVGGLSGMRESSVYQMILNEGRQEGRQEGAESAIRQVLLQLGEEKLGAPDPGVRQRIESLHGAGQLQDLVLRVLSAQSWEELLS